MVIKIHKIIKGTGMLKRIINSRSLFRNMELKIGKELLHT